MKTRVLTRMLFSLIWAKALVVCLPFPLHTWCQSWRGQDREGPPVRPECCTHMCRGISPRCHLCGWWCRWTRRWCPSAFWRHCDTGSSHIWHHCGRQDCERHEYNVSFFAQRNSNCSQFDPLCEQATCSRVILSARRGLNKWWRMVLRSFPSLTQNGVWILTFSHTWHNCHVRPCRSSRKHFLPRWHPGNMHRARAVHLNKSHWVFSLLGR